MCPFHDYRHFFCHYLINEGKADYVLVYLARVVQGIEALRRAAFLVWHAWNEPYFLTGIEPFPFRLATWDAEADALLRAAARRAEGYQRRRSRGN